MRLVCPSLFSAIGKNATTVTPSPPLASIAEHQIAMHRLKNGAESWRRTPINGIDAWLAACWQEARYAEGTPVLLSPSQERFLWQTIIEQEHPQLFDPYAAARLASRAAQSLAEWQIPSEGDLWNDHEDARQFQQWLKTFRRKCRDAGWIARPDLWRLVPKWIADGLCSGEPVVFAGFDRLTPALESLIAALPGSSVLECERSADCPAPAKSFADYAQELECAARCARAACEQNPTQTVGVFVPELGSHRSLLERTFEAVFYPGRGLGPGSRAHSAFHIHPARRLMDEPIAVNALLLLELARDRIDYADAGAILRSPFIAGAAIERSQRARADLELRRRRELDVSLRDLQSLTPECPVLCRIWPGLRALVRDKPKHAELAKWSRFMGDVLEAVGWPGDADLTAEEEDAVEEWNRVLSSLAALGLVAEPVTYEAALAHVRRLLGRPGVERGDWFSPVQIFDASQAQGLRFDLALVTGLSDEMWPPALDLSPLLPLKLQRAHGVPGTSPDSVHAERERLTRALFGCAPNVLATYSGRLSPSAERRIEKRHADWPIWNGKLPRQSFAPASLEEMQDVFAPRYAAVEPTRGGTSLIKSQSLCPFRAFAEFRLNARAPEDACFGFDARDRGGFVHKALQLVWNRLGDYETLRSTPGEQLRTIIREALMEAVRDQHISPLHELTTSAERERLENLILAWLTVERARKQPFAVETVEEECFYEAPGLRLRLRIDRIDRLRNGKVLLIDYKSGHQTRKKLNCPRPPEPQLWVYAAATGHDVDGVFFGELTPREPRAVGVSREKHFGGQSVTVAKDWNHFLAEAETEVERLANQFVEGYAAVDPLPGACEWCQIKPLCRVRESSQDEQDED